MFKRFQNPAHASGWRRAAFVIGLALAMMVWFGSRIYLHYHVEPMWHPMAKAYQDMAVSMNDGRPFGEINTSRIQRNVDVAPIQPYKTAVLPGDQHCQYRTLDPGYGVIFAGARALFTFAPDSEMRPVLLQIFIDFLLPFLLFATFYRWGWFAAVGSVLLYSLNVVFAASALTAWTFFWDGLVCILALISLLWLYRMARENTAARWVMILLAVILGTVLGAGIWIRNSWFLFGIVLLCMAAFSKTLRPWVIYAAITFGIFAGGMALRSTMLNGYPSISTRMVWHTAFQGMGKFPNPYGIEDSDLYMFNRTYKEYGMHFNYCDYNEHDRAIEKDVTAFAAAHPGYVIESFAQRIFSDIFLNFDSANPNSLPFWNYGMLFLGWLGMVLGLWLGGELGILGIFSFVMYVVINVAYAFVYFIYRRYSMPTQALLLFGALVVIAAVSQLVRRALTGDLPKFKLQPFGWNGPTLANVTFVITALLLMAVMSPPVQAYLTPHFPMSIQGDETPEDAELVFKGLQYQVDALPPAMRARLMNYVHGPGHAKNLLEFAHKRLRHLTWFNQDGALHPAWMSANTSVEAYEAMNMSARFIQGVGYEWLEGFQPSDPSTWDGHKIRFKLVPNPLPREIVEPLLREKMADWGWQLTRLSDNTYEAIHTAKTCPVIRSELSKYFAGQCPPYGQNDDLSNPN